MMVRRPLSSGERILLRRALIRAIQGGIVVPVSKDA